MVDGRTDEINRIMPFYKSIGLPVSYKNLDTSEEEMEGVIQKAVDVPDLNVSAFPVTKEMLWEAVRKLEAHEKELKYRKKLTYK